jgi:hypothetical protein
MRLKFVLQVSAHRFAIGDAKQAGFGVPGLLFGEAGCFRLQQQDRKRLWHRGNRTSHVFVRITGNVMVARVSKPGLPVHLVSVLGNLDKPGIPRPS